MREPLMEGSPRGAISADWRPRHHALPSARVFVAGVLAAAVVVLAVAFVARNVASSSGSRAPLQGRELSQHGVWGLPTAAALAVARGLGADDRAFWVRPGARGLVARDRPAGIGARFTRSGVAVRTSHGTVGISLVADGAGGALRAVAKAAPVAHVNRVFYRRAGLSEWYANGPLGLEQGLTIASAPLASSSTLSFAFALSGTLKPQIRAGALTFRDRAGGAALRYSDLGATDARGRVLPARMVLRGGRLILRVGAAGARYPIKVDPLLTPASADGTTSGFGYSVASAGTTVVVGAPAEGTNINGEGNGAAYVFVEPQSGWQNATQNAELTASDGKAGDQFGQKVDLTNSSLGATVFVGAPYHNSDDGAVYVFSEPSGGWGTGTALHQTAELTPGASLASEVGFAVAATASPTTGLGTVVIGAPAANADAGAAEVFVEPSTGWASSSTPTASLAATGATGLGTAVGITTSPTTGLATVVAGAPATSSSAGALYVYVEPAAGWADATLTSTLTATGGGTFPSLGSSVAITTSSSGSTTVVGGAPYATVSGIGYAGAAYVFVSGSSGTWTPSGAVAAELTSSAPAQSDLFGGSVATTGTAVFVADRGVPNSNGVGSIAGVWEFDESALGWGDAALPASLTYSGDSSYSDGLLAVEGDPTTFLGEPGLGDVNVICPGGGACPPITATPRTPKLTATCTPDATGGPYPCDAQVSDASGQLPAKTPTGAVTFKASSGTFTGVCTLAAASGGGASCAATYKPSSSSSPRGATVSVTASYAGDPNFAAGSGSFQLTIPKTCKVPKVEGDKLSKAKTAIRRANCKAGKVSKGKSLTARKGRVASTNPKSGAIKKTGTKVKIVISTGKPNCKVPKLKGDKLSKAKKALHDTSCKVGKITRSKSSKVAKGKVISSSPKPGSSHKPGTKVTLTVSSGKH